MKLRQKIVSLFMAAVTAVTALSVTTGAKDVKDDFDMENPLCGLHTTMSGEAGAPWVVLLKDNSGPIIYGVILNEGETIDQNYTLTACKLNENNITGSSLIVPETINGHNVTNFHMYSGDHDANKKIKSIYIPKGVGINMITSSPGEWLPFAGFTNLTDIYYGGSEEEWSKIAEDIGITTKSWEENGITAKAGSAENVIVVENTGFFGMRMMAFNSQADSIDTAKVALHFNAKPEDVGSTTEKSEKPAKVSGIKKARAKTVIKLSWGESKGATSYVVKYSTDKKTWKTKTVKTNSVKLSKLKAGTKYYIKVAAKNSAGTSSYSKVFSVTTKK